MSESSGQPAIRLDVPFLAHDAYVALLTELGERVTSVHFGLEDPAIPDARHATPPSADFGEFVRQLAQLRTAGRPRAYALLNSAFHASELYTPQGLFPINARLAQLLERDAVDGVVFADGFLLQAFSDAHPDTAARLEAVPSVNCQLATPGALHAILAFIDATRFQRPSRLVPARELNRDMDGLTAFAAAARAELPGVSIALLANEGCLPHCAFRSAHSGQIALERAGACGARGGAQGGAGYGAVRDLGCLRTSAHEPHRLLTSPFIRPEDAHLYAGVADALKLCGRTRGPRTLSRIVRAYARGRFRGNLLDLLDAAEPLARAVHVDNEKLGPGFGAATSRCRLACSTCGHCVKVAEIAIHRRNPTFDGPDAFQNRA